VKAASLILVALSVSLAPAAPAAQTRYAAGPVRVRAAPSASAALVTTVPRGAAVSVKGCTFGGGTWCAVEYSGRSGYAAERYLSPAGADATQTLVTTPQTSAGTRRSHASSSIARRTPRRAYAASTRRATRSSRAGSRRSSSSGSYQMGPRGGCYTYSASGRKRYVDHSYCN